MGDSSGLNDSDTIAVTEKIMVMATVVLFLVAVFVLFLHLYAKWFWYRRQEDAVIAATAATTRRQNRLDLAPGSGTSGLLRGLDPSLLKSLPIVIFNPKEFKDGLECAVCLSELADCEKARLLPKCNHGFHLDCIDMWFQSHSTCPLCRNPVSSIQPEFQPRAENPTAADGIYSIETPNFPTNVLFWGNQTRVCTLGASMGEDRLSHSTPFSQSSSSTSSTSNRPDGCLVIDIPRQIGEEEEEEEEETKSPVTRPLRSLRRLLSRDRRMNSFSPNSDPEQQISRGQS